MTREYAQMMADRYYALASRQADVRDRLDWIGHPDLAWLADDVYRLQVTQAMRYQALADGPAWKRWFA